jgi:hypothetical protein
MPRLVFLDAEPTGINAQLTVPVGETAALAREMIAPSTELTARAADPIVTTRCPTTLNAEAIAMN